VFSCFLPVLVLFTSRYFLTSVPLLNLHHLTELKGLPSYKQMSFIPQFTIYFGLNTSSSGDSWGNTQMVNELVGSDILLILWSDNKNILFCEGKSFFFIVSTNGKQHLKTLFNFLFLSSSFFFHVTAFLCVFLLLLCSFLLLNATFPSSVYFPLVYFYLIPLTVLRLFVNFCWLSVVVLFLSVWFSVSLVLRLSLFVSISYKWRETICWV
jgi:hypothetical protein